MSNFKYFKSKLNNITKQFVVGVITAIVLITSVTIPAAAETSMVYPVQDGYTAYGYKYDGYHNGLDIWSTGNDTIYAASSGTVIGANNSCCHIDSATYGAGCEHYKSFGNSIYILGNDGLVYYYGHLLKDSLLVGINDTIQAGQPIAQIGSSGYSTGKHLHFEVRKNNSPINVNEGTISYSRTGYLDAASQEVSGKHDIESGFYSIRNIRKNVYINTLAGKNNNGTALTSWSLDTSCLSDTMFYIQQISGENTYKIFSYHRTKALDVYVGSNTYIEAGNPIDIWSTGNYWDYCQDTIINKEDEGFSIRFNSNSSLCAAFSSYQNGAQLRVENFINADNQLFYLCDTNGNVLDHPINNNTSYSEPNYEQKIDTPVITSLKWTKRSKSSLTFRVSGDANTEYFYYEVYDKKGNFITCDIVYTNEFKITGLSKYTAYKIHVYAGNDTGFSQNCLTKTCRTKYF